LEDIHHHRRETRRQAEARYYVGPIEVRPAQFHRLLDDSFERTWRAIAAIEPYQRAQMSDHVGGAIDLRRRLPCGLRNVRGVAFPGAFASATKRV
jgi:hypothetical protein